MIAGPSGVPRAGQGGVTWQVPYTLPGDRTEEREVDSVTAASRVIGGWVASVKLVSSNGVVKESLRTYMYW